MAEQSSGGFPRWVVLFYSAIALLVAVGLGVAAASYGGIPHDHDRFGVVPVPGQQILELPAGRVMIDRVDDVYGCWNNTSHVKNANLNQAPPGMAMRVVSTDVGHHVLAMTAVSPSLYQSQMGCRGHEPFGRIDVPKAGRYLVQSVDDASGPYGPLDDPSGAAAVPSTTGPGFAFGPAPLAPFGSPLLGGIAVGILVLVAAALLGAVGFLIWGDGPFRMRWQQLSHPMQLLSGMLRN